MKDSPFDLIKWAAHKLEHSHVPCATKDAETLFAHSFEVRGKDAYLMESFRPRPSKVALFRHYVRLRASRFPLQYIVKSAEFMGLSFALEKGVFIPRPETELLVEKLLETIDSIGKKRINILEIGTGCGNIAISLTKKATGCKIIASDISGKALKAAVKNAGLHGAKKDIKFVKSNYFDNISSIYYNYFDIIVSNPPYVSQEVIKDLQLEIAFEDIKTLDGGNDGLRAYRRIFDEGFRYLKNSGTFALEIGYDQRAALEHFIKGDDRLSKITFYEDYNGNDRILVAETRRGKR